MTSHGRWYFMQVTMIPNSVLGPSTSNGSAILSKTTWGQKEKLSSTMFHPRTWPLTSSQRRSQGNSTGNSSRLWDYNCAQVGVSKTTTPSSSKLSYWTPKWLVSDQHQSEVELLAGTPTFLSLYSFYPFQDHLDSLRVVWRCTSTSPSIGIKS